MHVTPTMGLTTKNYDILTRLAVGNGALVYHAVNKVTHRQVALKLLVQEGDVDHRFNVDALLTDSPRLRQITGAHVCQLLDAYKDEDGPVLVYEYVKGTAGSELPSKQKLDAAQALDIAAQLISALRSGERQKCPHGDVKPSNVIFMELADKRLFTLVLDWGLTAYRTAMADDSFSFLAPERLGGAGASHRADLFSAGAALFFLCTGKMLVTGTNRTELQAAWQRVRPAVLAELRPDLPAKFVQWVCSLLELTPEKRPESAVDALAALAALNPPAAPVPPESFRPRPVAPTGSGISKPPPAMQAKLASALRKPPPKPPEKSSAVATPEKSPAEKAPVETAPVTPPAKPGAVRVRKSHVAMTIGLFFLFVALVSGAVWFVFFRKTEPVKYPGEEAASRSGTPAPARTPAPSVGQDIGKKFTPPTPAKKSPTPKPNQSNQAKKPTPTPKAKAETKPATKPQPAPPETTPPAPPPPAESK
jgi:serine/threonine-protein kinase